MIAFGEFAPDVADYNIEVSKVAKNVLPGINSYLPVKTLTATSGALDAACKGAVVMKDNSGNNYVYAGDATKLYNINGATVTDYSKGGGYTSNSEFWEFVYWNDQVIATKMGDPPQVLTLGGTTFADLSGTPPQGRTVATVRNFVVFGNTWDATDGNVTNRVWWSGFGDETEWTRGDNQSNSQDLQGAGGAVQKIYGGEYGIVFQERAIWRMDYAGVPTVWEFSEIELNRGTPAPRSTVKYGELIFYLGQDGFYVLTGENSQSIGNKRIDNFFWNDVNESYLANITAAISPEQGYIFWAYPSTESAGTPDKILVYNFKSDRWSFIEEDVQYLFLGATSAYTLENLDAFGTLETIGISLDDPAWQGGAFKIGAFDSSNQMGFFSGSTMAATVETGHIYTEGRKTSVTGVRPIIDGTTTITLLTKDQELSDTESATMATSTAADGVARFRTNARYHRIRCATSGDFTHAAGVEVDQVPTSMR